MSICKAKEVLKQVIVRKPDHKLQIKFTVDISTHALERVKTQLLVSHNKRCASFEIRMRHVQIDISLSSNDRILIFQFLRSEEGQL